MCGNFDKKTLKVLFFIGKIVWFEMFWTFCDLTVGVWALFINKNSKKGKKFWDTKCQSTKFLSHF